MRLVEEQVEAQGLLAVQNGNAEAGVEDDGQGDGSILESLRKRICQGRERHTEVGFLNSFHRVFFLTPPPSPVKQF